jgi:hypothetical protein
MLMGAKLRGDIQKEHLQALYTAFPKHDKAAAILFPNQAVSSVDKRPLVRKVC